MAPALRPLVAGARAAAGCGLRVLVVDNDERVPQVGATASSAGWGCIVETARDGKEAVTIARLSRYDAMLADIRLPDLVGLRGVLARCGRPSRAPMSS